MANNRLYIVNTETKEYCCVAKDFGEGWGFGNPKVFDTFLYSTETSDQSPLIIGTENDDAFFEKWIKSGVNVNKENTWEYL